MTPEQVEGVVGRWHGLIISGARLAYHYEQYGLSAWFAPTDQGHRLSHVDAVSFPRATRWETVVPVR
jgi:hypothetical protein